MPRRNSQPAPSAGAPRRRGRRADTESASAEGRLIPPPDGVTVRMYRIGHGDCFLLAFPSDDPEKPVYVLIDCGYKPGSTEMIVANPVIDAGQIAASIKAATGGEIDVAVITHEHQDHVNAITKKNFSDLKIGQTWLAWTEDGTDEVANKLRKAFEDKLLGLVAARRRLAAAGDTEKVKVLDQFLAFELGGEDANDEVAVRPMLGAAGKNPLNSLNKKSMKLFRDLAAKNGGVKFLRPHEQIETLPRAKDVRVFPMGPPRDPDLLSQLDPQGDEAFHLALSRSSAGNYFAAAAKASPAAPGDVPFARRYCIPTSKAMDTSVEKGFFRAYYGGKGVREGKRKSEEQHEHEVPSNAVWRRIDTEWLYSAEALALDMNNQTNNSSLVLAFELGKGGKVLLFAADAQRGNWISWAQKSWKDGRRRVTAKDLLARTVLYKVGHHGSHNATLDGKSGADYANLNWMAQGKHGDEFTAMITAVRAWAETQKGWDHPLKAIKEALLEKAGGRVFQTDTDFTAMRAVGEGSQAAWKAFQERARGARLYFDYTIKI